MARVAKTCVHCDEYHDVEQGVNWKCSDCNTLNTIKSAVEPKHYTDLTISPLEYITGNEGEFTWCIGNVIKYVSRYKRKNGLEDLKKAQWYLNEQIRLLEVDTHENKTN